MKKIYVKEEACIACHLCEVYCRAAHSKSSDLVKAFKTDAAPTVSGVWVEEKKPVSFAVQCRHCDEPACVYACLTGALRKEPDSGIVTVDTEKCTGCWTCILACPHGAIRQDKLRKKIVKCDMCRGKDTPRCVANCPNGALIYAEAELAKVG